MGKGELDAAIVASVEGLDDFESHFLYSERFLAYVSVGDPLFAKDRIKVTDLTDEYLWLLDEGHCFRDQLVKFCNLKSATRSKKAYTLGSIETFRRIVENGKGVAVIPALALGPRNESQLRLVRRFILPEPRRDIIMITRRDFIRKKLLDHVVGRIRQRVAPLLQRTT